MFKNLAYNFPLLVQASQDILSTEWTQGNLYKIADVTNLLGSVLVWIISVTGFCIVFVSLGKNALAALYFISPTFWNKVDEVKNAAIAAASGAVTAVGNGVQHMGGNNGMSNAAGQAFQKLGSGLSLLLSLVPNIKELLPPGVTDQADKKQYFMKAIPLAVAEIMIGMVIFRGYPAKIAGYVGNAGLATVDALILDRDPLTMAESMFNKTVFNYPLATNHSEDAFDKLVNKSTKDAMTKLVTYYSDMTKESKTNTALQLEQQLQVLMTGSLDANLSEIYQSKGYENSLNVVIQHVAPTIANTFSNVGPSGYEANIRKAVAVNGTIALKYYLPTSVLNTGSTKASESDYIVWTLVFTPVAVDTTATNTIHYRTAATTSLGAGGASSIIRTNMTVYPSSGNGEGNSYIKADLGIKYTVTFYTADGSTTAVDMTAGTINGTSGGFLTLETTDKIPTGWTKAVIQANSRFTYNNVSVRDAAGSITTIKSSITQITIMNDQSTPNGFKLSSDLTDDYLSEEQFVESVSSK